MKVNKFAVFSFLLLGACDLRFPEIETDTHPAGCGDATKEETVDADDFAPPGLAGRWPAPVIVNSRFPDTYSLSKLVGEYIYKNRDQYSPYLTQKSKVLYISGFQYAVAHSLVRVGDFIFDLKFENEPGGRAVVPQYYQEYFIGKKYYADAQVTEIPIYDYAREYGKVVRGINRNVYYFGAAFDLLLRDATTDEMTPQARMHSLKRFKTSCFHEYLAQ